MGMKVHRRRPTVAVDLRPLNALFDQVEVERRARAASYTRPVLTIGPVRVRPTEPGEPEHYAPRLKDWKL